MLLCLWWRLAGSSLACLLFFQCLVYGVRACTSLSVDFQAAVRSLVTCCDCPVTCAVCKHAGIAELQKNYTAQLSQGPAAGGGGGDTTMDMAIALDELQWFSNLFRHEKKVFSQVCQSRNGRVCRCRLGRGCRCRLGRVCRCKWFA